MVITKREAFSDTNAKPTVQTAKVQINDNAELTTSAHSDDPLTNGQIENHDIEFGYLIVAVDLDFGSLDCGLRVCAGKSFVFQPSFFPKMGTEFFLLWLHSEL